uniref:Uncharacterized protein n=1 Tax=Romanomermis culicivorax TaxID=13658 RepID=A0A915ITN0_ROMCU
MKKGRGYTQVLHVLGNDKLGRTGKPKTKANNTNKKLMHTIHLLQKNASGVKIDATMSPKMFFKNAKGSQSNDLT